MNNLKEVLFMSKYMMISISVFLISATSAIGEPSIVNVINENSSITINGDGFGLKTNATPFLWEDWESGQNGTKVDTNGNYDWAIYRNNEEGKGEAIYSDEKPYAGSQSMVRPILAGQDFSTPYVHHMNTTSVYISFMINWEVTAGEPEAVHKWWRITSGPSDPYTGTPSLFCSNVGGSWGFLGMNPGVGDHTQMSATLPPTESWSRVELHFSLSNPAGTETGKAQYWLNGENLFDLSNVVTSQDPASRISSFLLPAELANADLFRFKVFLDDLYVSTGDESLARVEIGNASTFDSCTHREIQIPVTWTDTSVSINVNQGGFAQGESVYLFVVDADNVASIGYPITIGGTLDTIAPSVPSELSAQAQSQTQIDLSWTASTDNVGVAGYRIYRDNDPVPVGTSTTTYYSDTELSPLTQYTYAIVAYDAEGNESNESDPSQASTLSNTHPYIHEVSGNLQQAQTVTITGENFGIGDTTPLVWDDFEDGMDGESINATPKMGTWEPNHNPTAIYTQTYFHSGLKSLYGARDPQHQWANFNVDMPNGIDFYQSFWFRYHYPEGDDGQSKLSQIHGTCGGRCEGATHFGYNPGVMTGGLAGTWWANMIATEITDPYLSQRNYPSGEPNQNVWHYFEMILKQSDAGIENGTVIIKIDGQEIYNQDPVLTRDIPGERWNLAEFFTGMTNFDGPSYTWIDDVYLNDSWARVEIGDSSIYSSCIRKDIQIPSNWSNTSITIDNFNQGEFHPGQTVFLYVTNQEGNTNTEGYSLIITGGVPDTQAPSIPTNLTATQVSSSQIDLSWTASTDNVDVTGYLIYRNGIPGETNTTTNYTDTELAPSTQYTYAVAAYDASGNVSELSESVQATTLIETFEEIIDNTDASTDSSGNWSGSTSYPGYYGSNYLYSDNAQGAWFEWDFNSIPSGNYEIYSRWTANAGRPDDVIYHITYQGGTVTVSMDQTQNGGAWNLLGTYSATSSLTVRINSSSNGTEGTCADAVRIVQVTGSNNTPVISPLSPINKYEGEQVEFDITVTDNAIDTITLSCEEMPQGATLTQIAERTWTFSWQTDFLNQESYTLEFIANDGTNDSEAQMIQINISDVNTDLNLSDHPMFFQTLNNT